MSLFNLNFIWLILSLELFIHYNNFSFTTYGKHVTRRLVGTLGTVTEINT